MTESTAAAPGTPREEETMRYQDIQKMAKRMGLQANKMRKTEMVRAIQRAEGNNACYGTAVSFCEQHNCLWREDCLAETEQASAPN